MEDTVGLATVIALCVLGVSSVFCAMSMIAESWRHRHGNPKLARKMALYGITSGGCAGYAFFGVALVFVPGGSFLSTLIKDAVLEKMSVPALVCIAAGMLFALLFHVLVRLSRRHANH